MAPKYSSKDIKSLIAHYQNAFKEISKSSLYAMDFSTRAKTEVLKAQNADIFLKKMGRDIVESSVIRDYSPLNDLLLTVLLDVKAAELSESLLALNTETQNNYKPFLDDARRMINPVLWLFTSKERKRLAEQSLEYLFKHKTSDFFAEASICQQRFDDLKVLRYEDVEEECERRLEQISKRIRSVSPRIRGYAKEQHVIGVLNNANSIVESRQAVGELKEKLAKNVKTAIDRLVADELMAVLKTIPLEELLRNKTGIKVKTLRDAGYMNIADIYVATTAHISSIYGISWDMACNIKRVTTNIVTEAQKGIKIKLTSDNKNASSTKVVVAVYSYFEYLQNTEKINEYDEYYDEEIGPAFKKLVSTSNGFDYCFSSLSTKKEVLAAYETLSQFNDSEYYVYFKSILKFGKRTDKTTKEEAWDSFNQNSIKFYNIIEEICPGVLGTDDTVYGLPEDLAREIQDECIFPDGLLCTLRRYQEWGVKYILHQEKVLLGDEMGLGKTIQAIAAMVSLKNTGATHFVVVCPASVVTNWCREIAKHSKLRFIKVHGQGKGECFKTWLKQGGVAVTTYETVIQFLAYEGYTVDMLIVDEAHYIKNENATRSRRTRKLAAISKRILFMTGTALENNVDEMISLIEVLNTPVWEQVKNIAFMHESERFRTSVAPVYYRRKRTDVLTELPDLIENEDWCEMSPEEEKVYDFTILNGSYMQARRLSWNIPDLRKSCKANRMLEIIEEAKEDGRKVIVFSYFLDTIRSVFELLGPSRCMNPINGSINPKRRQDLLDEFEKAPAGTVLPAQIQSGGTGLNIQAASVVIICEPQFKPSIENQAISRAYRMGQSRNVHVHRLLCSNTIDEKLMDVLAEKQRIFNAFADKSVAAEKSVEVDDKTFGDIIKQEIDRINKKNAGKKADHSDVETNVKPVTSSASETSIKEKKPLLHGAVDKTHVSCGETISYDEMMNMNYNELCSALVSKYGPVKFDYFNTPSCASRDTKNSRSGEGLECHHMFEDTVIQISKQEIAIKYPFDYQRKENLVYCNWLEHLLLHIIIAEKNRINSDGQMLGIGGCVLILTKINDGFNGYVFKQRSNAIAFDVIKDEFKTYIALLRRLRKCIEANPNYRISFESLCSGSDGKAVERIRSELIDR